MVKRIITSVVALAVFVGILFLPPICFTVALAAVILFMLYECYSATKADCRNENYRIYFRCYIDVINLFL
ncbi:MAG: phosphatidate cytidylyltransferase [Eubacteriales bacterium]